MHLHPVADEPFTVLSGRLEIVIAGQHEMLYPGESLTVAQGRPHDIMNCSTVVTTA